MKIVLDLNILLVVIGKSRLKLFETKMIRNIIILVICTIIESSFKLPSEYTRLQKIEHRALQNAIGKAYVCDFTGKKDCNKSRIKYLGVVQTKKGKRYKILTSFFVFSASETCHGTSNIKVFNMKNRYVGRYYVGMPDDLPDTLIKNRLFYLENLEGCDMRKTRSANLGNGLPKVLNMPCSGKGGELYGFSS